MKTFIRCHFLALILFLYSGVLYSQNSAIKAANKAFNDMYYPKAIALYEEILTSKKFDNRNEKEVLINLAFAYKRVQDYKNAELTYKDLFKNHQSSLKSEAFLCYAQVLASLDRKRESQKYYSIYGEMQKEDLRAKRFSVAYMDLTEFYKDTSLYKIKYMEGLNTAYPDFSPMYFRKGLAFVSARNTGKAVKRLFTQNETPFLDLFWAKNLDETDSEGTASVGSSEGQEYPENQEIGTDNFNNVGVEPLSKELNSKYHEGPMTFFKGYRKVVFTRNSSGKNNSNIRNLKLYSAVQLSKDWGKVEELPFNSKDFSCGHPALSPDNRRMYFVSDMPGGHGGTDLYVVDYKDGVWGSPINLGTSVNTEGDELFPFVDAVGNLFFASDGHAGLGGLDIFTVSLRSGIPFGEVLNMGAPLNSPKDDFGYISNGRGDKGFFSSNRKNGFSDDNIYGFEKGCKTLELMVLDTETQEVIPNAEVVMSKDGQNISSFYSNSEGKVKICLEKGHDFTFKAAKEGYRSNFITFGTLSSSFNKTQELKLYLGASFRPLIKGKVISELSKEPIQGATVTLTNDLDGSIEELLTGQDGTYTFQPIKDGTYSVSAVKEFHTSEAQVLGEIKKTEKINTVKKDFGMIAEGDIFGLDNIYFDRDKSTIRADAKKELDLKVLPFLKRYPGLQIELRAHTDARSSEAYNQILSEERALAVMRYLIGKGISPDQLKSRGLGESELAQNCLEGEDCNDRIHQQNRRAEFKVLSVGGQMTASRF